MDLLFHRDRICRQNVEGVEVPLREAAEVAGKVAGAGKVARGAPRLHK